MSTIKPFAAIRPTTEKVAHVVSHSIERYSTAAIQNILATNPFSFLQVIYSGRSKGGSYTEQLHIIKGKLNEFNSEKIFEQDKQPCFYIYRQIKDGRSHLGVIALASVEEYKKGIIKIHEQTLAEREEKLKEYLTVCDFNAEPVCLTHAYSKELHDFLYAKSASEPLYDFTYDHVKHSVWKVSDKKDVAHIEECFKHIPALYIADGHHRAASSTLLAEEKKKNNPKHTGREPYNYFMAAFFADKELTIYNFDRMVSSLNNLTTESFLKELAKDFHVTTKGHAPVKPHSAKEIILYIEKHWYLLKIKEGIVDYSDPVNSLDVSILSNHILSPILSITDLRNDKRISFVPGIKDMEELQRTVDSGKMKAAFCLYPISFKELKAVADNNSEMPPKSTWIEPKFESGLLIYSLA